MRLRPESPATLAVLRIAVSAILLVCVEWRRAPAFAAVPPSLRFPPEGLRTAVHLVPISVTLAHAFQGVFVASALLALVGLFTRPALIALTASALYLFGLAQLSGSVLHDMHLLWFAGLLAASPSGDVLSIDAMRARRLGAPLPTARSLAHTWPIASVRVLLGLVYLFPGTWKLATSGWAWALSDNLRNEMYWKWYELGWVPALRLDHWPLMCRACALGVVFFELSFLPLALVPRTRALVAAFGVVFHIGTQVLMGIPFFGLWGCYVALFDWEWLLEPRPEGPAVPPRPPGRAWVLGVALTVAAAVQGARGAVQAWPFACYPTFQWMLGTEIPDVSMVAVLDDGRERRIPPRAKSQAGWATAWTVAGTMGRDPSPTTLRAYWDRAARDPKVAALAPREVHFFRAWYSVLPEDRGAPPRREEPIGTISVRP